MVEIAYNTMNSQHIHPMDELDPPATPAVTPVESSYARERREKEERIVAGLEEAQRALDDGAWLVALLRGEGAAGFVSFAEKLYPENLRSKNDYRRTSPEVKAMGDLFELVLTLRDRKMGDHTELLGALVDAAISMGDQGDRHTVASWVEGLSTVIGMRYGEAGKFGLLRDPADAAAAKRLAEAAAARTLAVGSPRSFSPIAGVLATHNFVTCDYLSPDVPFPLKPAIPDPGKFLNNDAYVAYTSAFLLHDTPRAACAAIVREKLCVRDSGDVPQLSMLVTAALEVTEDELCAYLSHHGTDALKRMFEEIDARDRLRDITKRVAPEALDRFMALLGAADLDDLPRALSEAIRVGEITPGTFVDVDGTLIFRDYEERTKQLNMPLVEALTAFVARGNSFTIITGGGAREKRFELLELGFPRELLTVDDKHRYKNKRLQQLIDDQSPSINDVCSPRRIHPEGPYELIDTK